MSEEVIGPEEEKRTEAERAAAIRPPKQAKAVRILNIVMLVLLVGSLVYSIVMICVAPSSSQVESTKSSYTLMLLQSVLGLVVLVLPSILERKLKIDIPTFMEIALILFLYGAIFLGEIRAYYTRFEHWDTLLHTCSGLMIGAIGFSLVNILNKSNRMHVQLSTGFVAIFAFCFAMAMDCMWELYEFTVDELFGTNMQKFIPPQFMGADSNSILVGTTEELGEFFRHKDGFKYALMDTMMDIVVDFIGAAAISIIGYVALKMKKGFFEKLLIKNLVVSDGNGGIMPAEDELPPEPAGGSPIEEAAASLAENCVEEEEDK